ncbi:hypothetical protein D0Z00_000418 [Geotrichum galactomycetum]|uniref:Uncharacterized protein n=1 Tax=Geotrichum galactomycetum TaxID=27317 RepID=A0ACB6V9K8_9ASCO|nr:hypothetical protein D0Z00_000418 [Geotrichum candidum]
MLFELSSEDTGLKTHGGVLEFTAEEGRVYLPQWMMEALGVAPGAIIKIANTNLEQGRFVKFEPQSTDFLDISDPRAVLENALRNYSTMTKDDIFQISYNNKVYAIKVLEVKPVNDAESICVIETDLNVDFAPPVGYVEPTPVPSASVSRTGTPNPLGGMASSIQYNKLLQTDSLKNKQSFDPFAGGGKKISNRSSKKSSQPSTPGSLAAGETASSNNSDTAVLSEPPNYTELPSTSAAALNLPFGQLFFGYPIVPLKNVEDEKARENDEKTGGSEPVFGGSGQTLRKSLKRKDQGVGSSGAKK